MTRLSQETLAVLPDHVQRPCYDRRAQKVGIVHIGPGAFHRAHQAVYADGVMNDGAGDWMISGVSIKSHTAKRQLMPQDGLYSVTEVDSERERIRVVGSVKEVLVLSEDFDVIMQRMTSPDTRIVSLTVTEKGYCLDPATGALDLANTDIAYDLTAPGAPASVIGLIVMALEKRRGQGSPPFTVLSCDNLPSNGRVVKRALVAFAGQRDDELGRWINRHVSCPNSMVDRIVPAPTSAVCARAAAQLGTDDDGALRTEPFCQWVIEDDFPTGRPPWEKSGVILAENVEAYEQIKLGLLNGAHSAMAYFGELLNLRTIADAVADHDLGRFVRVMMRKEIQPVLTIPAGFDQDAYIHRLLERFANTSIDHECSQVAMDGSVKIPQRWISILEKRIASSLPSPRLVTALAAWMMYLIGRREDGQSLTVHDPMAETLTGIARQHAEDPAAYVTAFLEDGGIVSSGLAKHPAFQSVLVMRLHALNNVGARAVLRGFGDR